MHDKSYSFEFDEQFFVTLENESMRVFVCSLKIDVKEMVQVQKLVEMGFPEAQVRSSLEAVGWDENLALEKLCSG